MTQRRDHERTRRAVDGACTRVLLFCGHVFALFIFLSRSCTNQLKLEQSLDLVSRFSAFASKHSVHFYFFLTKVVCYWHC